MTAPLAGVRVLDTSSLAPGAYASVVLAELGADVVKIERPRGGDPARRLPQAADGTVPFQRLNRGKRSVVADLTTEDGRDRFDRLVARADVVIENYLPSVAVELGVIYERLRHVNPSIVLCSVAGFAGGSDRAGHDLNFWAESGALEFVQSPGDAFGVPTLPVSDMQGGLAAAVAISAALFRRSRDGAGDHVRVALADTMIHGWAVLGLDPSQEASSGFTAARPGYGLFLTSDGRRLAVGVEEERFWAAFCELIGRPDLAELDRMATGDAGRFLTEQIAIEIRRRPLGHWLERLGDLPVGPVVGSAAALTAWTERYGGDLPPLVESVAHARALPHSAPELGAHDAEVFAEWVGEGDVVTT